MEFCEARDWYEQMGGDLGKLPSYVGYTDAVEKVLDLGKPEVEEESEEEEEKNCLLYTSPSPRDGLLSRMPSSA